MKLKQFKEEKIELIKHQRQTGYQKYKTRKEQNMRNHIEGKFGQGKNGYNLDQIRAKRKDTFESWISAILFIMNLTKLMKVTVEYGYFLAFSAGKRLRTISLPVVVYDWIPVDNEKTVAA